MITSFDIAGVAAIVSFAIGTYLSKAWLQPALVILVLCCAFLGGTILFLLLRFIIPNGLPWVPTVSLLVVMAIAYLGYRSMRARSA